MTRIQRAAKREAAAESESRRGRQREAMTRPLCVHRPGCIGQMARMGIDELDCSSCGDYERDGELVAIRRGYRGLASAGGGWQV